MKVLRLIIGIVSLLPTLMVAQSINLDRLVRFEYHDIALNDALRDVSDKHSLNFLYSQDVIPAYQKISVSTSNIPLSTALEELLAETKVVYVVIGNQIALTVDPQKEVKIIIPETPPAPVIITFTPPPPVEELDPMWIRPQPELTNIEDRYYLEQEMEREMANTAVVTSVHWEAIQAEMALEEARREEDKLADIRGAARDQWETLFSRGGKRFGLQLSVFPNLAAKLENEDETTNNVFSVNVLWGQNSGLTGLEVGGLSNTIRNNATGFQIAGLTNKVHGDLKGTQISGISNTTKGEGMGLQMAGLSNTVGKDAMGLQIGGLVNRVKGDLMGMQVAGLGNRVNGEARATQIAGLYNHAGGKAGIQVAGLINRAKKVEQAQIAGLINVAEEVDGFQLGIINVSDSVGGAAIGLINIVHNGYNRVELAWNDMMHFNASLKLGAYSFYNIFLFGIRWGDQFELSFRNPETMSWGVGYGIGSAVPLGDRSLINFEITAMQVNERSSWTNTLNLLSDIKATVDIRMGRKWSIFAGPVVHIMTSKLQNTNTEQQWGSDLANKPFYERTNESSGTNIKMWTGLTAGLRF